MDREKKERGHTESLQNQRMPKPADGQKRQNRKEAEKLQERQAEEAVQQELGEQNPEYSAGGIRGAGTIQPGAFKTGTSFENGGRKQTQTPGFQAEKRLETSV